MSFCTPPPFSDDPIAERIREQCDYSQKITLEMAKNGTAPRPIRIYADGAFDLFHQGHARQLGQAKNMFPNVYLLVGVCSDAILHEMKGRTVLEEEERYNAVRHCRYTDEVIKDAPWVITDDFLNQHKIDFVAHDSIPYESGDIDDIYAPLKERGMFVETQRTEGVSTSDLVARIVRDYDMYIRRNLNRGYSAKELNVPYLVEKKIRFQNKMHALKDRSKRVLGNIGTRKDDIFTKWEERSRDLVNNFVMMFRNRNLKELWNESKDRLIKAITPPTSRAPSPFPEDLEDITFRPSARKMRRLR